MTAKGLKRLLNFWPPFLFSGIRVEHISDDWRHARVRLKLRWYNRNYVGTQYGGNLFSMTDPFWMILVLERLGRDYIVWDRAAEIRFVAPGRGDVIAEFDISDALLNTLRTGVAEHGKVLHWCETPIVDARSGDTIAVVRKQLYVKLKPSRSVRSDLATAELAEHQ
ncbi:DUF4442 domain-containing protein [Pseudomarimonas arenosa]|uniref:DUF4442 domain-containing protein n=1 Tax=Pseudomarimonas arenosa TaxID=2774145 RepID=A0AAW3ZNM2_9GAMM|nr:DUF4442 domain-containing protein [Pseudomarimonas arenosa]MBD8527105.1 DUF4442 domain-containing protein [Pseudomarimonas arenosa]